jgi:anti-sigma B factor antagonist
VTRDLLINRHTSAEGVVRLAVAGELDMDSSPRLESASRESVDVDGVTRLEIDLDRLTFMDSTGIRVLLAARQLAGERGIAFQAVNPRDGVRQVLDLTGVLDLLTE